MNEERYTFLESQTIDEMQGNPFQDLSYETPRLWKLKSQTENNNEDILRN